MRFLRNISYISLVLLALASCDVKDDIPYPIVHGQITEFEVEGQCGPDGSTSFSTAIDKDARSITLYVNDTVDLSCIRITKIGLAGTTYNPDVDYEEVPSIIPDSASCINFSLFPKHGFSQPLDGQDTRMNFSHSVKFKVHTYQDYEWTVHVSQVVNREIEVSNQIGEAIIDAHSLNAIIYVNRNQSLKSLKVTKFTLGGEHGIVSPDPTKVSTYDFNEVRQFVVKTGWGETQIWRVAVHHTDAQVQTTAKAFARNYNVTISGEKPNGTMPVIEYRQAGETTWTSVSQDDIKASSTTYSATIEGLMPSTKYQYQVSAGTSSVDMQEFLTLPLEQLPNSGFDDWSTDPGNAKLYCPWAEGGSSFWDTGNRGATTVGNSNSMPSEDTKNGNGMSAYLESKYIVIKFAAGNIFTGTYLKTDGTNGVLGFGRPFTAFPTKLSFDYKYKSMPIDRVDRNSNLSHLKGRPDSCNVYVALWHVEEDQYEDFQGEKYPLIIRTKPGIEQNLFSINDPRVIAYGQFTQGQTIDSWTSEVINIDYKNTELQPTHILIVASSSKYGDFFTGGVGSTLQLDNLKLIYE